MAELRSRRPVQAVLLLGVMISAVVAVLFFLPLGGANTNDARTVGGHPLLDKPAPEIELRSLDGETVTLSSLRGRPVLVNFWATWCPPCVDEFPLMVDAYARHADDGLEILGILSKDLPDGGRKFATDMHAEWPILDDPEQVAWDDYVVSFLPTSYFVDVDGVVRAFSLGGFTEEGLAAQLGRILPEAAA